MRHYARRTIGTYEQWVRRFLRFHGLRPPREMGQAEINTFLTHLAVEQQVSASSQTQALSALLFLYRHVLGVEPGDLNGVVRASVKRRAPVVMTPAEIQADHAAAQPSGGSAGPTCQRSGGGIGEGGSAARPGQEIPQRRPRVGLAVGVPPEQTMERPNKWATGAPPPRWLDRSKRGSPGRGGLWDGKAGELPHLPTLVCHPPAGAWGRHPHHPGIARPQ